MSKKNIPPDDLTLFHEHMKSVTPLKNKTEKTPTQDLRKAQHSVNPATTGINKPVHNKAKSEPKIALSDYVHNAIDAEAFFSFNAGNIPKKRFQQLKQGTIPWESRLDLHGMPVEEARHQFIQFIQNALDAGKRCVLIIHGKGGHQGQVPILKNLVNLWLRQIPAILAFSSAIAKHGGSGAAYILLKQQKEDRRILLQS